MGSQAITRHDLEARIVQRSWEDKGFRQEFLADPAGSFSKYLQVPVGSLPKIAVHEEMAGSWHIVLPAKPSSAGGSLRGGSRKGRRWGDTVHADYIRPYPNLDPIRADNNWWTKTGLVTRGRPLRVHRPPDTRQFEGGAGGPPFCSTFGRFTATAQCPLTTPSSLSRGTLVRGDHGAK
jgi:hypothetical protein